MAFISKPSSSPLLLCNPYRPAVRTHFCRSPIQSMNRVNPAFSCALSATKKGTFTVAAAAAASATPTPPTLDTSADIKFGRIAFSDVEVRRQGSVYWGRKWNAQDMSRLAVVVVVHLLCLGAPFTFSWAAFWLAVGLYPVTGLLGICLCYHRCITHKSFKLPKWLEYFFAYCGVQAIQGDPIDWVSTHRNHHQFCDTERDPHSPFEGFMHSHLTWYLDSSSLVQRV